MDYVIRCIIKFWQSTSPHNNIEVSTKEILVAVFGFLVLFGLIALANWVREKYFENKR